MTNANITDARILQIAPLAPGWHYSDFDRAVGFALVEITFNNTTTRTELYYLAEDLTLVGADENIRYAVGDDTQHFAEYGGPDWTPAP